MVAGLIGAVGCDEQPNRYPLLGKEQLDPAFPFRGVVPCAHPMPRSVGFEDATAVGVSAEQAFGELEGQCSAPFVWTSGVDAEETEISVEVVLDKESAVEVSYPATDACVDHELEIRADIALSTADEMFSARGRGKFTYRAYDGTFGPVGSATLVVSSGAVSGAAADGRYVVRVGGAGSACAGELRWEGDSEAVSPSGSWSASGCAVDLTRLAADSSPELTLRMEQLGKAWRDVRLDAAWETGDETQLELDVDASSARICRNQFGVVSVPVEVRYGTSDGAIPAHDALGTVVFASSDAEGSLRLSVEESSQCSTLPEPAPRYCENLSQATLRLDASHPNVPGQRLTRLVVDGTRVGSEASTQQVLHAAGTPHTVECLFTFDCPIDEICDDGFCRQPRREQRRHCITDSDCIGLGGRCRVGTCGL